MAREIIRLYLLFTSIIKLALSFVSATCVIFFLSRGLDMFVVSLINLVFFLVLFICEIPTGVIADIFGRKMSFVLSCFLSSASMFIYASSYSLVTFILAAIVSALGVAF